MNEDPEWRTIAGFPYYEVSRDGRVRSWLRRRPNLNYGIGRRRALPRELRGTTNRLGYVVISLFREDGARERKMLHRIVAEAFLPPPNPGETDVAHGDGNPGHNWAANLRWATRRDNLADMRVHGTIQEGESNPQSKLSAEAVRQIRARAAAGARGTIMKLAREYGVGHAEIGRILTRKRWASVT